MTKKVSDKKYLITFSNTGHVELVRTKAAAVKAIRLHVKNASKHTFGCVHEKTQTPQGFAWVKVKCIKGKRR